MIGDFPPFLLPAAALLFTGGMALVAVRAAWWWWRMRRLDAEIACWEKRTAEAQRENAYLSGVLSELDATIRIQEAGREVDDVARWQ